MGNSNNVVYYFLLATMAPVANLRLRRNEQEIEMRHRMYSPIGKKHKRFVEWEFHYSEKDALTVIILPLLRFGISYIISFSAI